MAEHIREACGGSVRSEALRRRLPVRRIANDGDSQREKQEKKWLGHGAQIGVTIVRPSTAAYKLYTNESGTARKIDDHTVEFTTAAPNPVETSTVANIFIMSRKWCEKNNAAKPQDITAREETFAALHANGTGPFIVGARE